jgi:hypothetical protein
MYAPIAALKIEDLSSASGRNFRPSPRDLDLDLNLLLLERLPKPPASLAAGAVPGRLTLSVCNIQGSNSIAAVE